MFAPHLLLPWLFVCVEKSRWYPTARVHVVPGRRETRAVAGARRVHDLVVGERARDAAPDGRHGRVEPRPRRREGRHVAPVRRLERFDRRARAVARRHAERVDGLGDGPRARVAEARAEHERDGRRLDGMRARERLEEPVELLLLQERRAALAGFPKVAEPPPSGSRARQFRGARAWCVGGQHRQQRHERRPAHLTYGAAMLLCPSNSNSLCTSTKSPAA